MLACLTCLLSTGTHLYSNLHRGGAGGGAFVRWQSIWHLGLLGEQVYAWLVGCIFCFFYYIKRALAPGLGLGRVGLGAVLDFYFVFSGFYSRILSPCYISRFFFRSLSGALFRFSSFPFCGST